MSESYSVVLTGKLLNGESLDDVKAKVGAAFKLKEAQLDKLFSGKPVALKRGLDKKQAVRLSTRLQQLGAHAVIKAVVAKPVKEEAAKPSVPFTDIVAAMSEPKAEVAAAPAPKPVVTPIEPVAEPVAEAIVESNPITAEETVAMEAIADEPAAAANSASVAGDDDSITCPRCGQEQAHTTACGHCKMDLTLHIKRLERKAKALAARRA